MTNPTDIQHFAIADPRTFDGNPYEVAERSVEQSRALAKLLAVSIEDSFVMSRNAAMERQLALGQKPDVTAFEASPEGKRWQAAKDRAQALRTDLGVLVRAAGFDPKAPLGRE